MALITRLDKEKATALTIMALAHKCGLAYTLHNYVDMQQGLTKIVGEFVEQMEPNIEYGCQVIVPDYLMRKVSLAYTAPQRDESLRAIEFNTIACNEEKE